MFGARDDVCGAYMPYIYPFICHIYLYIYLYICVCFVELKSRDCGKEGDRHEILHVWGYRMTEWTVLLTTFSSEGGVEQVCGNVNAVWER